MVRRLLAIFCILAAVLFAELAITQPVAAAAPRLLMIYGSALARPVILDDWNENGQFMLSIADAADVTSRELAGRPYLSLAFFWGQEWVDYVAQGKPISALRPAQGNQHGRFYPAFGNAAPVVTFDSIPGPGPLIRMVESTGLDLLARHGIPINLDGVSPIATATPLPTQTPAIATSPANVEVASEMGPAPTNCGPAPEPLEVNPDVAPSIGGWPVWGTIAYGKDEAKGVLGMPKEHPNTTPRLDGWWAQKVLWFVKLTYKGEVKLHGFNIVDNSPIYFTLNNEDLTTTAILNPDKPGAFSGGSDKWAYFPSLVWVSKAGCYIFEAQWDGGMWRQTIAVGYVDES